MDSIKRFSCWNKGASSTVGIKCLKIYVPMLVWNCTLVSSIGIENNGNSA